MRLRKIKDADSILQNRPDFIVQDPFSYKNKWHTYFKNTNPINIEIGMGKGKFIIEHALRNPDINYIGIEKESSVLVKALSKIETKIPNLVLANIDATYIKEMFDEKEVEKIYLNFSDPWPKNRHSKRRLTNNINLENYKFILKDNGKIEFKTDNRHLFEFSLEEFIKEDLEIVNICLDLHEDYENIITTEYEEKFISAGKNIYFIEVKKWKE